MSAKTIDSFRGEGFTESGTILKGGVAYPTGAWTGFSVVFTARRKKTDAALITKTSVGAAGVALGASGSGLYTVTILAADTSAFTKTELLVYEVRLVEPNAEPTVVAYGTWRVLLS